MPFPFNQGSQQNLEILILSVQVQKKPGIFIQKHENLNKTRNLAENLDKTWNVKMYSISILYWDIFLCSCNFRMLLGVCLLVPILCSLKPEEWPFWPGQILEFYGQKIWEPLYLQPVSNINVQTIWWRVVHR